MDWTANKLDGGEASNIAIGRNNWLFAGGLRAGRWVGDRHKPDPVNVYEWAWSLRLGNRPSCQVQFSRAGVAQPLNKSGLSNSAQRQGYAGLTAGHQPTTTASIAWICATDQEWFKRFADRATALNYQTERLRS